MTERTVAEAAQSALSEFDNVRWDDVWANLQVAGAEELAEWTRKYVGYIRVDIEEVIALAATPSPDAVEPHKPGEFHTYRQLECEVCGQRGQIVVSIEPQRADPQSPTGEEEPELCPDCPGTGYVRHSGDMHFHAIP